MAVSRMERSVVQDVNSVNVSTTPPASNHLELDDIAIDESLSSENLALQESANVLVDEDLEDDSEPEQELECEVMYDMETDNIVDL